MAAQVAWVARTRLSATRRNAVRSSACPTGPVRTAVSVDPPVAAFAIRRGVADGKSTIALALVSAAPVVRAKEGRATPERRARAARPRPIAVAAVQGRSASSRMVARARAISSARPRVCVALPRPVPASSAKASVSPISWATQRAIACVKTAWIERVRLLSRARGQGDSRAPCPHAGFNPDQLAVTKV